MGTELSYEGSELALFQDAKNWKRYFSNFIGPYLKGDVLEVGAGIGGTTTLLVNDSVDRWHCLEPDRDQADSLQRLILNGDLPAICEVTHGTIDDLGDFERFDNIIYIDVLEHIEYDRFELEKAAGKLEDWGTYEPVKREAIERIEEQQGS